MMERAARVAIAPYVRDAYSPGSMYVIQGCFVNSPEFVCQPR